MPPLSTRLMLLIASMMSPRSQTAVCRRRPAACSGGCSAPSRGARAGPAPRWPSPWPPCCSAAESAEARRPRRPPARALGTCRPRGG
eukprot:scaffold280223_cov22-Prasinocladus_malaysianus.AAC.1